MRLIIKIATLIVAIASVSVSCGAQSANTEMTWPRELEGPNGKMTIYTPQVESWKDKRELSAWMAVNLQTKDMDHPIPGAMLITAKTSAGADGKLVDMSNIVVEKVNFPDADDALTTKILETLRNQWADKAVTVEASKITAQLERDDSPSKATDIKNDPPKIFMSKDPALLVQFDGAPALVPLGDSGLLYALNTNWDVIVDTTASKVFLLNDKTWLHSSEIEKPNWQYLREALPGSFAKIPADDDNWSDVRAAVPAQFPAADAKVPTVFISYEPAELIQFDGEPKMKAIEGTKLMSISNTESDLFYYMPTRTYYYLISGRWFSSASLDGGWTYCTPNLPEDFALIPPSDPMGRVLASVPGTDAAKNAITMATMPKVATVDRGETTFTVAYGGDSPEWKAVGGVEGVQYATNASINVLATDAKYYCVSNGVWYVADNPNGPWSYCDSVPQQLMNIPASEPTHSVTYVRVYDSTPSTIVYGYTNGYQGTYVSDGTVVYGTGYNYQPYINNVVSFGLGLLTGYVANEIWRNNDPYYCRDWGWWGRPRPYPWWGEHRPYYMPCYGRGYGFGGCYNPWTGGWARRGYRYGPYGGFDCGSRYNPWTGRYTRGYAAYGPYRNTYGAQAFNPRTNTFAGMHGGSGPYGSWNSSYIRRGDQWMQSGRVNDVYGYRNSAGGGGIWGSDKGIITDRNGNHYIKTNDGWNKYDGRTWSRSKDAPKAQDIISNRPNDGRRPGSLVGPGGTRPSTRPDNMFMGKDGQIYRKNGDKWQSYAKDGKWNTSANVPGNNTRPGTRPGNLGGIANRPGNNTRPGTPDANLPGANTRPGTRPGTTNPNLNHDNRSPGQATGNTGPGRPGGTPDANLPGNNTRPNTRPGDITRPGQTTDPKLPGTNTRPNTRPTTGNLGQTRPTTSGGTTPGALQNLQQQSQVRQTKLPVTQQMNRQTIMPRQPSVQRSMPSVSNYQRATSNESQNLTRSMGSSSRPSGNFSRPSGNFSRPSGGGFSGGNARSRR